MVVVDVSIKVESVTDALKVCVVVSGMIFSVYGKSVIFTLSVIITVESNCGVSVTVSQLHSGGHSG